MSMQVVIAEQALLAARVDAAARKINALSRAAALEFAFEIGKTVIESLYDGQLGEWRNRGRKEVGLRELAAHPALCISASTLYRSLAIYELCTRLGRRSLHNLGVSHLRAILGAPANDQAVLVARAEEEAWSVARLEREVADRSHASRSRGGRPRSPEYIKSIRRMGQLTDPEALEGLDEVDSLELDEAQELLLVVGKVRERISIIERELVRSSRERRNSGVFPSMASA